jgi:hypothetical protein
VVTSSPEKTQPKMKYKYKVLEDDEYLRKFENDIDLRNKKFNEYDVKVNSQMEREIGS